MAGFNPFLFGNPSSVGQQTAVGQTILSRASGRVGGKRSAAKRRAKKAAAPRAARARKKTRGTKARLVKGSAAAKAYMAKIRRKRR